jgi:hypothetical protein
VSAEPARGFVEDGHLEVAVGSGVVRDDVNGHHGSDCHTAGRPPVRGLTPDVIALKVGKNDVR